jgi:hypothetical protein
MANEESKNGTHNSDVTAYPHRPLREWNRSSDNTNCETSRYEAQKLMGVLERLLEDVEDAVPIDDLKESQCLLDQFRAEFKNDPALAKCGPDYERMIKAAVEKIDEIKDRIADNLRARGAFPFCAIRVQAPGEPNPEGQTSPIKAETPAGNVTAGYGPVRHNWSVVSNSVKLF